MQIVTGISLMLVFLVIGNFFPVLTGNCPLGSGPYSSDITFNIPYTILSIMPKLRQTSRYTYEAALIWVPFPMLFTRPLPDLMPGILSGFSWHLPCPWMIS